MNDMGPKDIAGMTLLLESFSASEWTLLMEMLDRLDQDEAGVKTLLGFAIDIVDARSGQRLAEIAATLQENGVSEDALRVIWKRRSLELAARQEPAS